MYKFKISKLQNSASMEAEPQMTASPTSVQCLQRKDISLECTPSALTNCGHPRLQQAPHKHASHGTSLSIFEIHDFLTAQSFNAYSIFH
jgi:hypothetical protein